MSSHMELDLNASHCRLLANFETDHRVLETLLALAKHSMAHGVEAG